MNCGFKFFQREILGFNGEIYHTGAFYAGICVHAKKRHCRIREVAVEHFSREGGRSTGASLKVIVTAVRDLWKLSCSAYSTENRGFKNGL
jgi:hypothetical protein